MTYLITFSTYGSHLHGDERGSVDSKHNIPGSRLRPPQPELEKYELRNMKSAPYLLDESRRRLALQGVVEACTRRGWFLHAAHVRENHVHAIVESGGAPEAVLHALKSYASKQLNTVESARPRWTKHGSTRQLTNSEKRERAIHYLAAEQGEPMALFVAAERAPSCRASLA